MIEDLLQIAEELAPWEAGKPKQTSLRRSAATAYDAVLHALAQLCANQLAGRKSWVVFTPIYRSLEHQKARSTLNAARMRRRSSPDMAKIAAGFIALQDAQHTADYSPESFPFNRLGTLDRLDTAAQTVQALQDLSPSLKLAFAVHLIARSR